MFISNSHAMKIDFAFVFLGCSFNAPSTNGINLNLVKRLLRSGSILGVL